MTIPISSLLNQLTPDPWRADVRFSPEIDTANNVLFSEQASDADICRVLREWLQQNQPCLFGRIAAKLDLIRFCILRESDLQQPDELIEQKIQDGRLSWLADAYEGQTSNFIIVVISRALAEAIPNKVVAAIAQRLCSLYLRTDVLFDNIHHEHVFLEKPGPGKITWRWLAGVNYFSSQGDKRWWHDHRIPGGIAFSINSVGHLVRSEKIANAMIGLNETLGLPAEEGWIDSKIDSLEKALILAMRTISLATETTSGKATELLDFHGTTGLPKCPIELPKSLVGKNYCEYKGHYHTDYTLPSEYFRSEVERPTDSETFFLDFTYLFHKDLANPDFFTTGEGQRIREDRPQDSQATPDAEDYKLLRAEPEEVSVEANDILVEALSRR